MKKRLTYIDVINIFAIFAVLMLHSSQYPTPGGVVKNGIIQSIFIPAIYLFIMNSGATLIGYRNKYNTETFFIKRFKRVVIPLIAWSIIYYLYDIKFVAFPGPIPHPEPSLMDFVVSFLNNNINNTFWFFYAIILLYLLTPIISEFAPKHKDLLFYIVVLSFVGDWVYVYAINAFRLPIAPTVLQICPIASVFAGIFIMGYLIKENYFSNKFLWIFVFLGILSLIFGLYLNIFNNDLFTKMDYFGNSPMLFFYVIGIYVLIKWIVENEVFFDKLKIQNTLAKVASVSLGIYILHPIFFEIFEIFTKVTPTSFVWIWVMPVVTYVACGLIVFIAKKIPFVRDILP